MFLSCFQILKAIALVRLSREEEAHELVRTVLSSHPGEQATLQALTLFYREIGDCEYMCMDGSVHVCMDGGVVSNYGKQKL